MGRRFHQKYQSVTSRVRSTRRSTSGPTIAVFWWRAGRAEAFCVCEIDVIARNSNLKELAAFTAAAIGTNNQQGENKARADDLMSRLLPERKRMCGY